MRRTPKHNAYFSQNTIHLNKQIPKTSAEKAINFYELDSFALNRHHKPLPLKIQTNPLRKWTTSAAQSIFHAKEEIFIIPLLIPFNIIEWASFRVDICSPPPRARRLRTALWLQMSRPWSSFPVPTASQNPHTPHGLEFAGHGRYTAGHKLVAPPAGSQRYWTTTTDGDSKWIRDQRQQPVVNKQCKSAYFLFPIIVIILYLDIRIKFISHCRHMYTRREEGGGSHVPSLALHLAARPGWAHSVISHGFHRRRLRRWVRRGFQTALYGDGKSLNEMTRGHDLESYFTLCETDIHFPSRTVCLSRRRWLDYM